MEKDSNLLQIMYTIDRFMGMMMLLTDEISALEFCYINMTDQYINIVLKNCI